VPFEIGNALWRLGRFAEAGHAFVAASRLARDLGWLARAADAHASAAAVFFQAGEVDASVRAYRAQIEVETLRGAKARLAMTYSRSS
jgi:hypothetical protein